MLLVGVSGPGRRSGLRYSLRLSDLQAIIPAEVSLVGRLATMLKKTKGPTLKIKELPVAVSEHIFFVERD